VRKHPDYKLSNMQRGSSFAGGLFIGTVCAVAAAVIFIAGFKYLVHILN
jgi:hypothetical protein